MESQQNLSCNLEGRRQCAPNDQPPKRRSLNNWKLSQHKSEDETRAALEAWADHVAQIAEPEDRARILPFIHKG